jgi:RNA polymerase sigma-70 factor (ECF subfamily)
MEAVDQDVFTEQRGYLISLAYRMTGSMADAEDLLQEAYLRWQQAGAEQIRSPRAFLTTVVTRLAINHLESARVRREEYVGEWLPEPVITSAASDPAELSESLTMAFLVLLETLTPLERAVFLLHEVFDYSHAEIAAVTAKSEEACRQVLRRAKQSVQRRQPRFTPAAGEAEQLTEQFARALQTGDADALMNLLHEQVVAYSDGGGRARAAINPIFGRDHVARFLAGIARKTGDGLKRQFAEINAQPGFLAFRNGEVEGALVLDIQQQQIRAVYIVVNPDKLHHLPKENRL